MAKKVRSPDLDKYITEDKKKEYVTYAKAYRQYDLPYWTFVKLAKEAKATVHLRKTAVVDLRALDKYIEENTYEPEDIIMSKARKKIDNMPDLIAKGKKYVRREEAMEMYSIGRHSLDKWAMDAGALRKIGGSVLINIEKLDAFIESFNVEEDD